MKHLVKFMVFEADEVNIDDIKPSDQSSTSKDNEKIGNDALLDLQKNLKEYSQKKSVIESVFKEQGRSDADISLDLEKRVYNNQKDVKKRNPYLVSYESLCRSQYVIGRIEKTIEDDTNKISELRNSISELQSRSSELTDQNQIKSIGDQIVSTQKSISEVQKNINLNKSRLDLTDKNLKRDKSNFTKQMKIEEQRLKSL